MHAAPPVVLVPKEAVPKITSNAPFLCAAAISLFSFSTGVLEEGEREGRGRERGRGRDDREGRSGEQGCQYHG